MVKGTRPRGGTSARSNHGDGYSKLRMYETELIISIPLRGTKHDWVWLKSSNSELNLKSGDIIVVVTKDVSHSVLVVLLYMPDNPSSFCFHFSYLMLDIRLAFD